MAKSKFQKVNQIDSSFQVFLTISSFFSQREVCKSFKKSAFLMILLRNHKSMSKAIISLKRSHSGGYSDILNFSVYQNSKKLFYVLKNEYRFLRNPSTSMPKH